MKHLYLASSLGAALFFFAFQAWPQAEGIMVIQSKEFVPHQEPLVRFDHYQHENLFQCLVCHHDFRVFSNRNKGKGSKCSSCHKREASEDIPVPLLEAFHGSCITCHEKYLDRGRSAGPVDCDDCHGGE